MSPSPEEAFAHRLRALRGQQGLTQGKLGLALGGLSTSAISSYENASDPKLPTADRLRAYALFCAQDHSTEVVPQLAREQDLTGAERGKFEELHRELVGLRDAARGAISAPERKSFWTFDGEPITIICPEVPEERRSPLAKESNPNYTETYSYADVDALLEVWGQIRASNPELKVDHKLSAEIKPADLQGHLVILGGIGWHEVADWLRDVLDGLPVQQIAVPDLENGEIFTSRKLGDREFRPVWRNHKVAKDGILTKDQLKAEQTEDAWLGTTQRELVEDVALLARLGNPFDEQGTITICNGVYSRGVVGAAKALIDPLVRDHNEAYLATNFPSGSFAVLAKVPIVNGKASPPRFGDSRYRLYEWSLDEEATD
ncbi:helix-turn-helix domain-containing protein [Kribbella sp. NPDC051587]|uniref:helix-turn-helix domain-containing protein n=1 Tax=Kribbella sp. NPDC051587 TaxID=3364119 RepID=UPI0037B79158